jgi:beta-lactamase superfamily II metal-dependent hydrolase
MKSKIHILKASHGDSIIIETFNNEWNPINIVIDGGITKTYNDSLREAIKKFIKIDLLVLTHTDDDHIKGLISFFKSSLFANMTVEKYWANCRYSIKVSTGTQIGFNSGKDFNDYIIEKEGVDSQEKWNQDICYKGEKINYQGLFFTILSPTSDILSSFYKKWIDYQTKKEKIDKTQISSSIHSQLDKGNIEDLSKIQFNPTKTIDEDFFNAASIAFILNMPDCSILLLGDSRPEIVIESLLKLGHNETDRPLKVDYIKISHHGSKNNTNNELLNMIECDNFIFSTNGGFGNSKHPDRETVARILKRKSRKTENETFLIFNYPIGEIERKAGKFITEEECKQYNCKVLDNINLLPYE